MKNNKVLKLLAVLLCAALFAAVFAGCAKPADNNSGNEAANTAADTQTADTSSPDRTAGDQSSQAPDTTPAPDATGAASTDAAATPSGSESAATPGSTEACASVQPGETGGAATSAPITTIGPSATETTLPVVSFQPGYTQPAVTPTPTPRPSSAAPTATPHASATPLPNNSYEAHYAGAVIEQIGLKAGDSFYWTLDLVNEHSRLWSGQWLVDYPESYLTVENYTSTWSGGITAQVQATWDNETDTSDIPAIVCNPDYMGNTGGHPLGQAGNMYANVGMYLTSFHHYGVQVSGSLIRFKFTVKAVPSDSALKHDSNGYYIEIPVLVCESTAMIDAPAGYPVQPYTSTPHGHVTVDPGKIYIKK